MWEKSVTDDDRFWVGPPSAPETYQLVTALGGGAEGEVWTAVLPLSAEGRRNVAIKILPPELSGADEETWVRHGHLLRSISDPGLVRVLEVFTGPPRHRRGNIPPGANRYVVMDLIEGVTLREWLDENPTANVSQRLRALRAVAAALDEMHSGSQTAVPVAHGDVKPSNIVMRPDSSTVLVDLGLTRLTDGTGRVGRSRPYAAPELFAPGAHTTPDADRFAFVATLVHCVLGEPPPVGQLGPDLNATLARLQANPVTARRPILIQRIMEALAAPPGGRPTNLRAWLSGLTDTLSQVTETGSNPGGWASGTSMGEPTATGAFLPAPGGMPPAGGAVPPLMRPTAPHPLVPPPMPRPRSRKPLVLAGVIIALVLVLGGGGAVWALSGDDKPARNTGLPGTGESSRSQLGTSTTPSPTSLLTPAASGSESASEVPGDGQPSDTSSSSLDPSALVGPSPGIRLTDDPDNFIAARSGVDTRDNLNVNGREQLRAFADGWGCCGNTTREAYIDINLGRAYTKLTARFGLEDHSAANSAVRFEVFADGNTLYDHSFILGQSSDVTLTVTGVLRLRFYFVGPLDIVEAVVGEPTVFP